MSPLFPIVYKTIDDLIRVEWQTPHGNRENTDVGTEPFASEQTSGKEAPTQARD